MTSKISSRVQSLTPEQLCKIENHIVALDGRVKEDIFKSDSNAGGEVVVHLEALKLLCQSAIQREHT